MEAKNTISFPVETLELVQKIMKRYPEGKHKSAILPVLHLAQAEWKWCSPEVMDYVASLLSIEPVEVYEVTSFYSMFHLEPVGEHVIEYCRTGPCCLMGGVEVYDHLKSVWEYRREKRLLMVNLRSKKWSVWRHVVGVLYSKFEKSFICN